MIEVKKAALEQLDDIILIVDTSGLGHWTKSDYEKELENKDAFLLIASQNQKTIGFILARLITSVVEILNIAVVPEMRKQGIGEKLLDSVLSMARAKNAGECWLEVRTSNETAQSFYINNGFKVVGKRANYYSNPLEDAVLMNLML